jgi:hypothetical protein
MEAATRAKRVAAIVLGIIFEVDYDTVLRRYDGLFGEGQDGVIVVHYVIGALALILRNAVHPDVFGSGQDQYIIGTFGGKLIRPLHGVNAVELVGREAAPGPGAVAVYFY